MKVYDTPPMVVKGPSSGQDIYDTPASSDKNPQQTVRLDIMEISCHKTFTFTVFMRCNPLLLSLGL